MSRFIFAALLTIISGITPLSAVCRGKVDVGAVALKMNLVESGRTVRTRKLGGLRVGVDHFLYKALLTKLAAVVATGDAHFQSYSAGLGVCIPYKDFFFTPAAGATYTKLNSPIDFPSFAPLKTNFREKFSSIGPYVGLDAQWCFHKKWRIAAGFQYSWSHTHARVKPIFKGKSNSKGPSYTMLLERDITKQWSINLGGAINKSLSHEKHGVKLSGIKLGLAYWY